MDCPWGVTYCRIISLMTELAQQLEQLKKQQKGRKRFFWPVSQEGEQRQYQIQQTSQSLPDNSSNVLTTHNFNSGELQHRMHKYIELATSSFNTLMADEFSAFRFRDGYGTRKRAYSGRNYYPQQFGVSEFGKFEIEQKIKEQLLIRERQKLIAETRRLDSRSQKNKQQEQTRRPQSCHVSSSSYDKLYSSAKTTKNPQNVIEKCKSVASYQKTSSTKLNNEFLLSNKANEPKIHYPKYPSYFDEEDILNEVVRGDAQKQKRLEIKNAQMKQLFKNQQKYEQEIKILKQQLEQKNKTIVYLKWTKSKQPNANTKEQSCQTEDTNIKPTKILKIVSKTHENVTCPKNINNLSVFKLATVSIQKVDEQQQIKSEAKQTKQSFFTKSEHPVFSIENSELKQQLFDQDQSKLSISVPISAYNEPQFELPTRSKFEVAKRESITESVEFNNDANSQNAEIQFNLSNSDASYALIANRVLRRENTDDLTLSTSELPLMNSIRHKQLDSENRFAQAQQPTHLLTVAAQKLRRASYGGEQYRSPSIIEEEDSKISQVEEDSNVLYLSN